MKIVEESVRHLAEIDPSMMAHGANFPIELIERYIHPCEVVWDIGSGNTGEMALQLRRHRYLDRSFDINGQAVADLDRRGDWATTLDATLFASHEMATELVYIESIKAIVCSGLFASLHGDSWKSALDAMDMWLAPKNGFLFIADVLRGDLVYPELEPQKTEVWEKRAKMWEKRLERNRQAFGNELPERSFAVGSVGPLKNWFDWEAEPATIRYIYDHRTEPMYHDIYERMATHTDATQLEQYMIHDRGYKLVEKKITKWVSRGKDGPAPYLPGVIYVWKKPEHYRYHPYYRGFASDSDARVDYRRIMQPSPMSPEWTTTYLCRLLERAPESQRTVILELQTRLLGF